MYSFELHEDRLWGLAPALACIEQSHLPQTPSRSTGLLDALLDNGILWAAVPKNRRSLERRHIRRNGWTKMEKLATPKKNIVACLECGKYHEVHTLCGHCYSKVKEEQEKMMEAMPHKERLYEWPTKEVAFMYEGEKDDKQKYKGKYIVEMERPRPEWWPKNLMTKAR